MDPCIQGKDPLDQKNADGQTDGFSALYSRFGSTNASSWKIANNISVLIISGLRYSCTHARTNTDIPCKVILRNQAGGSAKTRNGMERNQLGHAPILKLPDFLLMLILYKLP